jgi:hypothetical protein
MSSHMPYTGPERRIFQRRITPDRRELIRFEPDKEPRRKNNGRREHDFSDKWTRKGF